MRAVALLMQLYVVSATYDFEMHVGNCLPGTSALSTEAECMSAAAERGAHFYGSMAWTGKPVGCVYAFGQWESVMYFNSVQPGHSASEHPNCGLSHGRHIYCMCSREGSIPTATPTSVPTSVPTASPTATPTAVPTAVPTTTPTAVPTAVPTSVPTAVPTATPTSVPTAVPTAVPTTAPTSVPTAVPTATPTTPTAAPTAVPTAVPTVTPTAVPTTVPTALPTSVPTAVPTASPTAPPTAVPTAAPTSAPTTVPTAVPTAVPTSVPTAVPTAAPTAVPTAVPTAMPTAVPTATPTSVPTAIPTAVPTAIPTSVPTAVPTESPAGSTPTSCNVFFSGHSLVNLDMPRFVNDVALAENHDHEYQEHMVLGSPMKWRMGDGLFTGQDREGEQMSFNMYDEIADAQTLTGDKKYNVLVVTEAVPVYGHIQWSSSLKNAGAFYDLLFASASGRDAYLYEVWPGVPSGDFTAWRGAVEAEKQYWEAIASVANLNPTRRAHPMKMLRGAQALAALVLAVQEGRMPGVSSPLDVFAAGDDIHLSNMGNYYMALFQYSTIYNVSPVGAIREFTNKWGGQYSNMPSAPTALALQELAWAQVQLFRNTPEPLHLLATCEQILKDPCAGSTYCESLIDDAIAEAL